MKYRLREVGEGVYLMVYTGTRSDPHWRCPTCTNSKGLGSVLHFLGNDEDTGKDIWECRVCPPDGLRNWFYVPAGTKPTSGEE